MKIKEIQIYTLCRCATFFLCGMKDCDHYDVHETHSGCVGDNQIQYCKIIDELVTDVPAEDIDKRLSGDPNYLFKLKKLQNGRPNAYNDFKSDLKKRSKSVIDELLELRGSN